MAASNSVFLIGALTFSLLSGCKKDGAGKEETIAGQYTVTTLAGSGVRGFADGPGSTAQFALAADITIDGQGNLYVADLGNYAIRKISPAGVVSTLAGGSGKGYADGQGFAARFFYPMRLTTDGQGNIYVVDFHSIRKITPSGTTTTLAGGETRGNTDGTGTAARFNNITALTADAQGNIFVIDNGLEYSEGLKIRKITPSGTVSTFSNEAIISSHLWTGNEGDLYAVGGFEPNEIVKFSAAGARTRVKSFPGYVLGFVSDKQGNFYFTQGGIFADSNEEQVFLSDASGKTAPIAGTGQTGFAEGKGNVAQFDYPHALALDAQGTLYVIDAGNNRIRKISR